MEAELHKMQLSLLYNMVKINHKCHLVKRQPFLCIEIWTPYAKSTCYKKFRQSTLEKYVCQGNQQIMTTSLIQEIKSKESLTVLEISTLRVGTSLQAWRHLSHDRRFPSMWYVRPAKAQTSLRIRTD